MGGNAGHDGHVHHGRVVPRPGLAANRGDPTGTKTARDRYSAQVYKRYEAIRREAVHLVAEVDLLGFGEGPNLGGMMANASVPSPRDVPEIPAVPDRFQFATADEGERIRMFQSWIQNAHDAAVLGSPGDTRWTDEYVRYAYTKGVNHADSELRKQGVEVPPQELADTFSMPVHRRTLSTLRGRQFSELDGITDAMSRQIADELTTAYAEGVGPREAARRVSDRVQKIGITRARTMARTEIINAHAESTLNRYAQFMGDEGQVEIQAEFLTAGDARVCDQCAALEGQVFTVASARKLIPVHPRCRCVWTPVKAT